MNILSKIALGGVLAAIAMIVYQCNGIKKKDEVIKQQEAIIKACEEIKEENIRLNEALYSLKNKPDTTEFSENRIYKPKTKIKIVTERIPIFITDTISGKTDTIYQERPSQIHTYDSLFKYKDYDLNLNVESKGEIEKVSHQLTTKFKPEITVKEVTKTVVEKVEERSIMTASVGYQAQTNLPEGFTHGPMAEVELNLTEFLSVSGQYQYLVKQGNPHMIQVNAKVPVFKKKKK